MSGPDDDELFERAMHGVRPIVKSARVPVAQERTSRPVPKHRAPFTVEGDLGFAHGVNRRQLKRLRSGKLPIEVSIDLHGHTGDVARDTVLRRVREAAEAGARCARVIHGRGHVLREVAIETLTGDSLAHLVLAYCPAQPNHGGAGALYVLLRRR